MGYSRKEEVLEILSTSMVFILPILCFWFLIWAIGQQIEARIEDHMEAYHTQCRDADYEVQHD